MGGRREKHGRWMDAASACSPLPFPLVQGGILVQYRNTSAASGSKKASYVEKGKAQGGQEYEGQISNFSNCKGKYPASENCKGKNPILPFGNRRSGLG